MKILQGGKYGGECKDRSAEKQWADPPGAA